MAAGGDDEGLARAFADLLVVFEQATTSAVSNWTRNTYKRAKDRGVFAQTAVATYASPAQVAALNRACAAASEARGSKFALDQFALAGAPSRMMRTLLLNPRTPDALMPCIWRDLALEGEPSESAIPLYADLCRATNAESEFDAFVRDKLRHRESDDMRSLELLGHVLLARPDAAPANDEGATARAVALHDVLLEYMLSVAQSERVWRLHPRLLAAMSGPHPTMCTAYASHLLEQTGAALQRLQAQEAHPPIWQADDELVGALCSRWEHLLMRGGMVGRLCAGLLVCFKQSCADGAGAVLDAKIFQRLPVPCTKMLAACAQSRGGDAMAVLDAAIFVHRPE